ALGGQAQHRPHRPTGGRGVRAAARRHRHDLGAAAGAPCQAPGDDRPPARRRRPAPAALHRARQGGNAMTTTTDALLVSQQGHVRILTNNNPGARNALTPAFYTAFTAALKEAEADPEVGALVLTGAGNF